MGPGARVRDLHRDPARETHRTAGCASVIRVRARCLPALLVVLAVVAALPLAVNNNSLRAELFLMFMLITLASSINIIMGYTGYVSFGHIVFFGLGGYFAFYLMQNFNAHFLVAALAGAIPASAIALVIGVPILRLRGAYFALATIGINEAMRTAINNFEPFGGAVGMFFNFSVYDPYGGARNAARLASPSICCARSSRWSCASSAAPGPWRGPSSERRSTNGCAASSSPRPPSRTSSCSSRGCCCWSSFCS